MLASFAMEKFYTCVACSKRFKVLSRPDSHIYRQHEVEMNVECPYCSKTNAIVWPQDECLPCVLTEDGKPSRRLGGIQMEILSTARELVAERLGMIPASRKLAGLRQYDQYVEPQIAKVLLTFVGIDSETDTLPIGAVRKQWSPEALQRKDREIDGYACRMQEYRGHSVDDQNNVRLVCEGYGACRRHTRAQGQKIPAARRLRARLDSCGVLSWNS